MTKSNERLSRVVNILKIDFQNQNINACENKTFRLENDLKKIIIDTYKSVFELVNTLSF